MTAPTTLTKDQIKNALRDHNEVKAALEQEGSASITLCFALRKVKHNESWKAIENLDTGACFASFSEYADKHLPQFSPAQISKRIKVAEWFAGKEVNHGELVKAGHEKLYLAIKLAEDNLIDAGEVLRFASEKTKVDLEAIRRGTIDKDDELTAFLTTTRVPRAFAARFAAQVERRQRMLMARETEPTSVTEITTLEFILNNLASESDEYLAQAADGFGGQPIVKLNLDLKSVPPIEAFRELFAELRVHSQTPLNPKELAEIAAQVAVEEAEYYEAELLARKAQEKIAKREAAKAEKIAKSNQKVWANKLRRLRPGSILTWETDDTRAVVTVIENMVATGTPPHLWLRLDESTSEDFIGMTTVTQTYQVDADLLAKHPPTQVQESAAPKKPVKKSAPSKKPSPLSKQAQAARGKKSKKTVKRK